MIHRYNIFFIRELCMISFICSAVCSRTQYARERVVPAVENIKISCIVVYDLMLCRRSNTTTAGRSGASTFRRVIPIPLRTAVGLGYIIIE